MNEKKFTANKIFLGLCFLVGAIALICNRLGYFNPGRDINVITVLISILLVWLFIRGICHVSFPMILFPLAFLAILYDELLGITALTPWTVLGSALLGSIGLSLLFPKHHHFQEHHHSKYIDAGSKIFDDPDDEVIHHSNTFGASIKYINTDSFLKGSFDTTFGEMKVYFDNATLKNGIGEVNIDVSFGSITLYIPHTWHVEDHVKCSFGDFKNISGSDNTDSPVLRVYGEVAFGDAKIIYI